MIVEDNFLSKLKNFGLNSYEAKLWTALLSRGVSTAGELSDIANVPRSRTYDVLESLEKKGFIIMKIGKPIKYLAVEPTEVVKRVQNSIRKNAENQIQQVEEIKNSDILNELNLLHNQGIEMINPTELSGSFKNRDTSYDHLDSMFKSAENSIILVTSKGGLLRKLPFFSESLKKAKERGVEILVAVDEMCDEFSNYDYLDIRVIDNLKSRFFIVDGEQVMFMLLDDESVHSNYDSGIWVNSPFFASSLKSLFDIAWEKVSTSVKIKN